MNVNPLKECWIAGTIDKTGIIYGCVAIKGRNRAEFYIDTREKEKNKNIFDELFKHKNAIEGSIGTQLVWDRYE